MLNFYSASGSPYAWRVALALEHKEVQHETHLLSFSAGDHKASDYLAINPRHRVPAIVDGDFQLYESSAILEYLEERFPEAPSLFPGDLHERAIVRRIAREVDAYVIPEFRRVATQLWFKKEDERDQDELQSARGALLHELAFFGERRRGRFLVGDQPSAADFTLYPIVASLNRFELAGPGWIGALHHALVDWKQAVELLPGYDATYPPHWRA